MRRKGILYFWRVLRSGDCIPTPSRIFLILRKYVCFLPSPPPPRFSHIREIREKFLFWTFNVPHFVTNFPSLDSPSLSNPLLSPPSRKTSSFVPFQSHSPFYYYCFLSVVNSSVRITAQNKPKNNKKKTKRLYKVCYWPAHRGTADM